MKGFRKSVIDKLREAGCYLVRQGKEHEVWNSPVSGRNLAVPRKIMSRHTANKVLKDAGLPKAF